MRLIRKTTVFITCAAVICGAAALWWVHKKATDRKLTEAASLCRARADRGDAKAQTDLGNMYYYGKGVPQDYAEAVHWFRKAADQGDARGQDGVGSAYYQGEGVPQDHAEAAGWFRKAAEQGYAKAQYDLGYMYHHGQAVPQDYTEATRWYRKAADQGYPWAQVALGLRTRPGIGIKIGLLLTFLGSISLLIGSRASVRNPLQRRATLTGIVGLSLVALSLYEFSDIGIHQPGPATDAFYFTKGLLVGMFGAMLISVFWPRIAKVLMMISGVIFIGFNIYALSHYDLRRLPPAIRLFLSTDGLLVGISIAFSMALWLPDKQEERKIELQ